MTGPRLLVIDAFCDRPFTGNPAAVCILESPRDAVWMQKVAAEMNLSETAFVCPQGTDFDLRWFTPMLEVDLCGHATLATARALWHVGISDRTESIRFHTRSGDLIALTSDGTDDMIHLDSPITDSEPSAPADGLISSLGLMPEAVRFVGRNKFDYLLELADESLVRTLSPDFSALAGIKARGIIVTARADSVQPDKVPYDFVSRFFAPASGIPEDPVTGSAHCALAPFWADRLGKNDLTGYQASRRGGLVRVRLNVDRVLLGGRAIVITEGRMSADAWAEGQ